MSLLLEPFETLYETGSGNDLPLPIDLAALYGRLQIPARPGRPILIANFVSTLDGVVSLNVSGHAGGGDISGSNPHDQLVMGILRSIADAVIVGAGTLRASPRHLWIAEYTYQPLADAYRWLRTDLGKSTPPLNVIVTARGEIDLELPVFQAGLVPVLVITTPRGAQRIREQPMGAAVPIEVISGDGPLSAHAILAAVCQARHCDVILTEGGPQLMGDFLAEQVLDELYLTLAPQIAGRDDTVKRPGLVAGKSFAPNHPLWGTLTGVKRGGSHLFLRYGFETR